MCQNYLVMSYMKTYHLQNFIIYVKVWKQCVDFYIDKFTQVSFSDFLPYKLSIEAKVRKKTGCFL